MFHPIKGSRITVRKVMTTIGLLPSGIAMALAGHIGCQKAAIITLFTIAVRFGSWLFDHKPVKWPLINLSCFLIMRHFSLLQPQNWIKFVFQLIFLYDFYAKIVISNLWLQRVKNLSYRLRSLLVVFCLILTQKFLIIKTISPNRTIFSEFFGDYWIVSLSVLLSLSYLKTQ